MPEQSNAEKKNLQKPLKFINYKAK